MSYPATAGSGLTFAADQVGSAAAPASSQLLPYAKLDAGAAGASSPVTAASPLPAQGGGTATATVAAGAGTTNIKNAAGRLCKVHVTATGTGTGSVNIFDNASAGTGTVLAAIPANATVGTVYALDMPAAAGLTAVGVANGPALTVSYY